jgi:nicotinate dehydrogenase subunit B
MSAVVSSPSAALATLKQARGFPGSSLNKNPLLRHWLDLSTPGVIIIKVGKIDIGQGISTAQLQIAAEELDVAPEQVQRAPINTEHSPDEGVTSGSFSIEHSGEAVRRACATLRHMAVARFCERHQLTSDAVSVAGGVLSAGKVSSSYWDLQLHDVLDAPVDPGALVKSRDSHVHVGVRTARRDLAAKLFGEDSFIQDMVLEGMLHARLVRQSNRAARLLSVDEAAFAERFPQARLVRNGSFLGVLAEREELAVAAAAHLHTLTRWDLPAVLPDSGNLRDFLLQTPAESRVVATRGQPEGAATSTVTTTSAAASATPAQQHQAEYLKPYIAHASIGPSCALAHWREGRIDVWCHSQGIFNLKTDIEVFLKRDHASDGPPHLVVHHVDGAGCYGHNPADDVAFEAVLLARAAEGRPVRLVWSRADELSCGPQGSAHLVRLAATLDDTGVIANWRHDCWANGYTSRPGRSAPGELSFKAAGEIEPPFVVPVSLDPPMSAGGGGDRNAIADYDLPAFHIVSHRLLEMPVRTSAIRALGGYANVFGIESFMDELAHASGQDPVAFRLRHLSEPRARAVIEQAIAQAPWWHDRTADVEGTGRGMAFARYKNTGAWCAVAVLVLATDSIRVQRISIAADVGMVVNPDGVTTQLEGGAIQSCSWTLKEALPFSRDSITAQSWDDYPILSFSEVPLIDTCVINQPGEPSLGAGEATQGPTAAAIGNAVFDALQVRIRTLPITPQQILAAMEA